MLVLSRKLKQEILIGDNVKITVLKVKGNTVRLGIEAPREVHVVRGELPQHETTVPPKPPTAEFTVVFSNSNEDQSPEVDVIPFEEQAKQNSSGSKMSRCDQFGADKTIQFRGKLPTALHNNRLKEIVSQLTTKRDNTNA